MMGRRTALGMLVVATVITAISPNAYAKEIRVALPIGMAQRDPLDLNYLEEWEIYAGVYDSLVQYDTNEGFTGILAERWSFDHQAKTLTFKIRSGAMFSDGSPLTAEDVAFSFRRILVLDRDHSQILTRCLDAGASVLKSPNEAHPGIRVVDSSTLILGPLNCGEALLNELANASYGVVFKKSVDEKFKVGGHEPFSGLFTYSFDSSEMILSPNLKNWRWHAGNRSAEPDSIRVVRFERDRFMTEDASNVDLLRISQSDIYERAKKLGYQFRLSLPIMTWFLAPTEGGKAKQREVDHVLADINTALDRAAIPYLTNNSLERPTSEFFPLAFNCGPRASHHSTAKAIPSAERQRYRIEIVDHPSQEGTRLASDLVLALRRLGYPVVDLIPAGASRNSTLPNTIRFALRRQFLGDSIPNIFNMLFKVLKGVPDSAKRIGPQLARLERLSKSDQASALANVCDQFHHYDHIPIASRTFAFAAKDPRLLDVFSKVTGNLLMEQFTKIGGAQ